MQVQIKSLQPPPHPDILREQKLEEALLYSRSRSSAAARLKQCPSHLNDHSLPSLEDCPLMEAEAAQP